MVSYISAVLQGLDMLPNGHQVKYNNIDP